MTDPRLLPASPQITREGTNAAKTKLLEVMATGSDWQEGALKKATGLAQPLLRVGMDELLMDGLVRSHRISTRMRSFYNLVEKPVQTNSVTEEEARKVIEHLQTRTSDTVPNIALYTRMTREHVQDVLHFLDAAGDVTVSFIGSLAIYRAVADEKG